MLSRRSDIEQPHANTCQWILQLEEYQTWANQPRGLLWIKGKPGAGKSTLMSFLYDTLRDQRHPSDGIHLDFFFTARGTEMQRTPLGMLRSMLNQLFERDESVRPLIRKLYQEKDARFGHVKGAWEWQQRDLEKLLSDALLVSAKQQSLTLFVDALDEAGEQSARATARYLHQIHDRMSSHSAPVKICISCRHYPIASAVPGVEIWVERHNHPDITAFVHERLHLPPDSEWQFLISDLAQRADGVFQWASLVVPLLEKSISDGDPAEEAREWLNQVPQGLDEVYEYVLQSIISPKHKEQSLLLFQWVCLADEPLTVTEMRYAMVARKATVHVSCANFPEFTSDNDRMKQRLITWSGGLVEIKPDTKRGEEVVRVIHQSVHDYFLNKGLALLMSPEDLSAESRMSRIISQSHATLYWSCLTYLATDKFQFDLPYPEGAQQMQAQRRPWVQYATSNLFVHAEKADQYRQVHLENEIKALQQILPTWIDFYRLEYAFTERCPNLGAHLLHVVSAANMVDAVEYLLDRGADPNTKDSKDATAAHFAAQYGHLRIIKILQERGANVFVKDVEGNAPLGLAAGFGQFDVAEWLLQYQENATNLSSALNDAAGKGQVTMVQMLLDAGADTIAHGRIFPSALQAAVTSSTNSEKMVQILLDAGADVNAEGGFWGTALQISASFADNEKVVRMLLDAGADVNAEGGHYGTALQAAASQSGSKETVQMLLDAGADVNAEGGHYGTALQAAASRRGRRETVQMLLDAGADVNAAGGEYGTALQAAASRSNNKETVQMLLDAGADVNAEGGHYGTALLAAVLKPNNEEVVRLLLGAGADVNAEGGYYGTALQAAASRSGNTEMVQILLDAGAVE